jgi:hypothetical protein
MLTFIISPVFAGEFADSPANPECNALIKYPELLKELSDKNWVHSLKVVRKQLGRLKADAEIIPNEVQKKALLAQYRKDRRTLKKYYVLLKTIKLGKNGKCKCRRNCKSATDIGVLKPEKWSASIMLW